VLTPIVRAFAAGKLQLKLHEPARRPSESLGMVDL
jgi:hypothetical protein